MPRRGAPQHGLRRAGIPRTQVTSRIVGALPTFAKHSIGEIHSAITTSRPSCASGGSGPHIPYLESRPYQPSRARNLRARAMIIVPRLPAIGSTGTVPPCQSAALLQQQQAPDELDHVAPDSGVACFGEPLFPPKTTSRLRTERHVIVIDWRLRRGAGPS